MSTVKPHILVFGASVVDITGLSTKKYLPCNSTPGTVKISYGGVSRNIAEMAARIGVPTKFISFLGDDEKGRSILEHSVLTGYDMSDSLIVKNGTTPTYLAILNENGEMVSAIIDMSSVSMISESFIDSKKDSFIDAEYVFVDSDNPELLEYILKKYSDKTKFVLDPISAYKAGTIKHLLPYFHTIKPNRYEAEVLVGYKLENDYDLIRAAKELLALGVKNVFISLDEDGIFYASESEIGKIKANQVKIVNVTGAGDSFVAGIAHGYISEFSLVDTVKFSICMSILTLSTEKTIHPEVSIDKIMDILSSTTWTEVKYL